MRYTHFNKETLKISLPENNIKYIHLRELGGRRKARRDFINTSWCHAAFREYADYMETDAFKNTVKELEYIALRNELLICVRRLCGGIVIGHMFQIISRLTVRK